MNIRLQRVNLPATKELRELRVGDTFIKDYHNLQAILDGTYHHSWSVYIMLPQDSRYLSNRCGANIFVYNLRNNMIHCIKETQGCILVRAEIVATTFCTV
jgi:hypothetical protein